MVISSSFADLILFSSLAVSVGAYLFVSRREGSYLNILTPAYVISIPAYYALPWFFGYMFGNDASFYAYCYVYATIAVENVAFAYAYTRKPKTVIHLPFRYAYKNFVALSVAFLVLAALMYAPVLLQFPEYILNPREIYAHTRSGFGVNFYFSSTFSYLAVILILFTRSRWKKIVVSSAAAVLLSLHGSKGQMLSLLAILALFVVYVSGKKLKLVSSLVVGLGVALFMLLLFAATMSLGESPADMLESISSYSDYVRNAMLVIDSNFPVQYGRLTLESQTLGRVPRLLMPNKPKNFGALYLADQFYPEALDAEAGAPDFGIGVQYADFGALAILYLAGFAILRGWLARIFLGRLSRSRHPADFVLLAFFANVSLLPVGGVGWLLPETFLIAILLRFGSCFGAETLLYERTRMTRPSQAASAGEFAI